MFGCVYILRNSISSKVYVGQTIKDIDKYINDMLTKMGDRNSARHISRAIEKYPFESWSYSVLGTASSREALDELEIKNIKEYDARNPSIGYNISRGGERGPGWPKGNQYAKRVAHRLKVGIGVSKALKGIPKSEAHKAAMTASRIGSLNHMWGKKHSAATRAQMSKTRIRKYEVIRLTTRP